MIYKELKERYECLEEDIIHALKNNINSNSDTIIYKIDQQDFEEGTFDYYITIFDKNGSPFEAVINTIKKNGELEDV